jgi:hypothetical protein
VQVRYKANMCARVRTCAHTCVYVCMCTCCTNQVRTGM